MASPRSPYKAKDEEKLMVELWTPTIADNPYHFVMFAFPWGQKGTPLENETGPRTWQKKKLLEIAAFIAENQRLELNDILGKVMQDATVSGRGVGKSALVAWIVLWFLTCRIGGTAIITANTEAQLRTKTWAEVGRWHTLAINSHWFEKSAMALKPAPWFEELIKKQLKVDTGYYYAQAILWSEDNPDAFAGAHNPIGMLLIFDEASGIPPAIWKVSKGFFTEEKCLYRFWFVFSNGRRNTGSFFECFHANRAFWRRTQIDARTVEGTDKQVYAEIIAEHGEDSDEAAVEVKGEFPKQGAKQFISRGIVEEAVTREVLADDHAALMMGVDIARYGDDCTVIRWRQGRNGRVLPPTKLKGKDNMEVANECAHLITKYKPDAVCIDSGYGTGVIDRLKEMGYRVHEVRFGTSSPDSHFSNYRTWLWAQMRDWLGGACIDNDPDLRDDLTSPEYKFQTGSEKIRLQTKEELKADGFASPDNGDALACTFAVKVARKDLHLSKSTKRVRIASGLDYSVFGS